MRNFQHLLLCAAMLLVAASCTEAPSQKEYVDWLYASMPLPDSLQFERSYWEANVEKTLEARKLMGWNIPEREFRHFVLPVRVNNEAIDDFRTLYADTLCARVKGMSLKEAALEINHWCHEQASYEGSDARTSSPVATVRRGKGRCGEESVLAVAAMRAAGIPARQVYTPRWAHSDDNHAWIEVWVDGKWHFMGACEPEADLDMAWFNGPVSRALLLHTKVFGNYSGDEDVIRRTPCTTEINVIKGYVDAHRKQVTVIDGGVPVEGARVAFKIYNYAEFYTVAAYLTDAEGKVSLDTGKGDMLVWASKGDKFGFARASSEETTVELSHVIGERFSADVDIVPPPEKPIPSEATEEDKALNRSRLAAEDSIRAAHPHNNADLDAFLAAHPDHTGLKALISEKDLGEISAEALEDFFGDGFCDDRYISSPRVEYEDLAPYRREILESGIAEQLKSPADAAAWTAENIRIIENRNPLRLRTSPIYVWRSKTADALGRNIFYVALCRTLGFPARLDDVTGKIQYRQDGNWIDVNFEAVQASQATPSGILSLYNAGPAEVESPLYYKHFTVSRVKNGLARLLEFGTDADQTSLQSLGKTTLEEGYYVLTSGTRLADGSVLAHLEFFNIDSAAPARVPLVLRNDASTIGVIRHIDTSKIPALKDIENGYFLLVAFSGDDEPSQHAEAELKTAGKLLANWGKPVVRIPAADSPFEKLPAIAVCDTSGNVVYLSLGYNTSLAADLQRVIGQL